MKIDKAIENAVASVKMEGYQVDSECVEWCKMLLKNKINMINTLRLLRKKRKLNSEFHCFTKATDTCG